MTDATTACGVHELIAACAARDPDGVAAVYGDRRISFAELDRQANQLAHYLIGLGAGPEAVIGVCLPRTAALVVTLLGVLKSGAAYLPVDPAEAPERKRFILRDADVLRTLTTERLAQDRSAILAQPDTDPGVPIDPASLAYVIYTSGSTGTPKGVMVTHNSMVNYLCWARNAYGAEGGGGVPLHSPVNTDLSVTSLFVPLLAGQPVVVLPEEDPPVNALPRALAAGGFRFVKLTPAHLEILGDALAPGQAPTAAHRLVVGGDALHYPTVAFWRVHAPEVAVVNEYGPTETTVACCAYEFPAGESGEGPVPIGTAIAGARLHVMDSELNLVPDGEVGELYIGGAGVARGYLGRPGLTAAAFVPDPWSGDGARLYRTGDLVHRDAVGRLMFHGRADDQVKLRGYRVELGEIEGVLRSHPDVHAAAVTVHDRGTGRAALVAHVVASSTSLDTDLTAFAAERLPAHMVPARIRVLEALPLTPQGKVDRAALDRPAETSRRTGTGPRTPLEEAVAEIFADLLDERDVDVEVSFFELGGNSLLAARLVARLIRAYQLDLPTAEWLKSPSVAGFAELIDTYRSRGRQAALDLWSRPEFDDLGLDDEILESLDAR
ncbi:amino acid adenylation domain-containing protein [Kutzneria sp. NPDC052558]|uniref:amino acid adenylation domain-containing protein n=1 Tax=Kutzneria sp. NPDC052558 TaxID=3364121 RepID=UPI0037C76503